MNPIVVWLVALMEWQLPSAKIAPRQAYPGWEETAEQRHARYESIAEDLYAVAYAKDNAPIVPGAFPRARTAAFLLALQIRESELAPDADKGPCYRGPGYGWRCDFGRASCSMQINMGDKDVTAEGWTSEELFSDRRKCLTAGLNRVRKSLGACRAEPWLHQLASYARGKCDSLWGKRLSAERVGLADYLVARKPPPKVDLTEPLVGFGQSGQASGSR